jgi:hypothetical protein
VTTLSVPTRTLAEIIATDGPAAVTLHDSSTDPDSPGDGSGTVAVVLTRVDPSTVVVIADGAMHGYPDTTPATEILDHDHRLRLVTDALRTLDTARRRLAGDAELMAQRQTGTLRAIRSYAIDAHNADVICLAGLNEFLRTFDLPEYRPRIRLTYTIRGSYEADQTDTHDASGDAEEHLRPDLLYLRRLVPASADHTVTVEAADYLDE